MLLDMNNSPLTMTDLLSEVLLSKKDKLRLLADKYKPLFLDFLKTSKKEITTSEIAKAFDLTYEDAFYVLKTLEREHKIVMK